MKIKSSFDVSEKNCHIGHCKLTAGSANVKVKDIFTLKQLF